MRAIAGHQTAHISGHNRPDQLLSMMGTGDWPSWLVTTNISEVRVAEPLGFSLDEYELRLNDARTQIDALGADALLSFRSSNVEYLSGFHTVNPYPQPLLVTANSAWLYVLDIEVSRAVASSVIENIRFMQTSSVSDASGGILRALAKDIQRTLGSAKKLVVDPGEPRMPPGFISELADQGVNIHSEPHVVERVRLILSQAEIEKMREAGGATQRGVAAALEIAGREGLTDSALAAAVSAALLSDATSGSALGAPIVATGERGGLHHSTFRNIPLDPGTTLLEFAGTHDRYHAPVMLTIVRRSPNELERRLEAMSQAAVQGVVEEVRPGRTASEVARAVAARIPPLAASDTFHWNFGYSVGLAHPPTWADGAEWNIMADNDNELRAGMAFHVPASFRSFAQAAVGLSHTIVVTDDGVEVLTGHEAKIHQV